MKADFMASSGTTTTIKSMKTARESKKEKKNCFTFNIVYLYTNLLNDWNSFAWKRNVLTTKSLFL